MSILDEITKSVESMSEDELRTAFIAAKEEKEKRKVKQLEYNASPEAKAKRVAYQQERNAAIKQDPEKYAKVVEQRKAYMSKPEVKMKQKAYRDERNAKMKLIMQRAKELGLDKPAPTA
jgi:hypothetical protein